MMPGMMPGMQGGTPVPDAGDAADAADLSEPTKRSVRAQVLVLRLPHFFTTVKIYYGFYMRV